jgi:hypothetical protein
MVASVSSVLQVWNSCRMCSSQSCASLVCSADSWLITFLAPRSDPSIAVIVPQPLAAWRSRPIIPDRLCRPDPPRCDGLTSDGRGPSRAPPSAGQSLIGFRGSPPAPIAQPVTPPTQASMHQPFSTTHVPWRARLRWLPGTRNRRFRRLERSQPVPSTGKPNGEPGTAVLFESGTTSSNPSSSSGESPGDSDCCT